MQSNTQLKEDEYSHNDYIIDEAVAESWSVKGFYDNAIKKDQEALADINGVPFPDEEEGDLAKAQIYQEIATLYSKQNRYVDTIVYQNAAIALGNRTENEHFICYAYYYLKAYDDAVRTCTDAIHHYPANLAAHYWRGVAYRDNGNVDAAFKDLTIVADSEHNFRTSAAIALSMIYFGKNDIAGYAYMELGQLEKALDDCKASLKYGSLPDAYRKQQELMKRLGAHGAN